MKEDNRETENEHPFKDAVCEKTRPDRINLEMNQFAGYRGMRQESEQNPKKENNIGEVKINSVAGQEPRGRCDIRFK